MTKKHFFYGLSIGGLFTVFPTLLLFLHIIESPIIFIYTYIFSGPFAVLFVKYRIDKNISVQAGAFLGTVSNVTMIFVFLLEMALMGVTLEAAPILAIAFFGILFSLFINLIVSSFIIRKREP
jgi:hypothetical protein